MEISDLSEDLIDKKIIFFGTGSASKKIYDMFPLSVKYFVDNASERCCLQFEGKQVKSPQALLTENKEQLAIIIASQFYAEIAKQLNSMGFTENIHYWNGYKWLFDAQIPNFQQIRIENTNICNYHCIFCPREKLMRPLGIMSLNDFNVVLERLKHEITYFSGQVHLSGYGEPTVDMLLPEKVYLLKKCYPESMPVIFTTLGVKRDKKYFEELVKNGLTGIFLSMYAIEKNMYYQIHGFEGLDIVIENLINLLDIWRNQPTFCIYLNPIPWSWYKDRAINEEVIRNKFLTFLNTINFPFKLALGEMTFHNFGDGRNFNRTTPKICSIVGGGRKEILQITYDLKVIPCCFDYNAEVIFGDLNHSSLRKIFNASPYLNFIELHNQGRADCYPMCKNCDVK